MIRSRFQAGRALGTKHFAVGRQSRFERLEDRNLLSITMPTINPNGHTSAFEIAPLQRSGAPEASQAVGGAAALPASYDLRTAGDVTSVKDQGPCGSCWAFATMASLESSILKAGGSTTNLSENNLKDYHGFDWGPCDGGNAYISQAYFTRGSGPVSETDDPYHSYDDRQNPAPQYPSQYYVRESPTFDTQSEIKNALMTYGALYTSMEWVDEYYRASDHTYYSNVSGGNHAVTIVGWNDSKATAAGTSGAWLIKNSWGTSWGEQGYFWLSYADYAGGKAGVLFGDAVPASTFNKIYSYDTFGDVTEVDSPYAFNAFTATSSDNLSAIQFWTEADNAQYDIRVYSTYSGGHLSGLLASTTGTETYGGAHTVDLPSTVSLTAGQHFYVYLAITNGGDWPMAMDRAYSGYNSDSTAQAGQSYYSFNGTSWTDLTTYNNTANFCIKALTSSSSSPEPDPTPPSASITGSVSHNEGNSGTTNYNFTVTLSEASTYPVTVNYQTADGTAIAGGASSAVGKDYSASSGSLTFAAGQTQKTITVLVNGDRIHEATETFTVNLVSATNAIIDQAMGTGTIVNEDTTLPKLSINSVKLDEGNLDTTTATFTVSLSAASGVTTTAYFTTTDGTATAASGDYVANSGTVTFAPGETRKTIQVTVNGDALYEAKETFTVNLSAPDGATIARGIGTATIRNEDPKPMMSIDDVTVAESPSGGTATFTVHLWAASGMKTTVRYGTVNGTAKAGRDYRSTSGMLEIAAGQTQGTITVPVLYNSSLAADARFGMKLSGPKQALLSGSMATCTIDVPTSAATLDALAAAQTPASRVGVQQRAQAVDELIGAIWLTLYQ